MIPQASNADFVVFSQGEAVRAQKDLFDRQTLATVRYADPAAWVLATAAARALAPKKDEVMAASDRVGVVVVSSHGPIETLSKVADDARSGFASPLRYPASNPGSLAGVSCILFGLQGPTLNLLMEPAAGVPLALFTAKRWLDRGVAAFMVVAACTHDSGGKYLARCLLIGGGNAGAVRSEFDQDVAANWLISIPETAERVS
jgi:3-oxoacyl-(acyl-carrier-protein) synthase